uniref:Uncharacterized protein n=1 Tax=Arundo donax TaxID=35708 RepID=A0A0A8YV04_ARUDO
MQPNRYHLFSSGYSFFKV